jgi:hypothetical protein
VKANLVQATLTTFVAAASKRHPQASFTLCGWSMATERYSASLRVRTVQD